MFKSFMTTVGVIIGIVLALYLGVWVMCVGGIVDMVNACKSTPVDAVHILIGLAKFLFAGLVGWFTFFACTYLGVVIGGLED